MELTRKNWSKNDINTFNLYLESLKNKNKIEWTKRIVNTKMKVLAIKTPILKKISNEILDNNKIEPAKAFASVNTYYYDFLTLTYL